jgi:threonine/homoserine/homoserine lactone efflux protein
VGALGPGFASATHSSWWVVFGIGVMLLIAAFATTSRWAVRTADQTAELLREQDRPAAPAGSDQRAVAA